jgi:3-hexulose-6-phosphate synthase
MKLQLALDRLTRAECLQILKNTEAYIDWIEVGTGVIKEYGVSIVRDIKERYPNKTIVADMKTCDAGRHEAIQAFEAGADITTVMAFSANKTISDMIEVAKRYNKRILVDLLGITGNERLRDLEKLGVNLVSLHFGKDMQQEGEIDSKAFKLSNDISHFEITVAGGITLSKLPKILEQMPDVIIIGSAITSSQNPGEAARKIKEVIQKYEISH